MTEVVWVTGLAPDRVSGGGYLRVSHLMEELGRLCALHVVSAGRVTDPSVRAVAASVTELGATADDRSGRSKPVQRAWDLAVAASGRTREVATNAGIRAAAGRVLPTLPADVVLVENSGLAPLIGLRPRVTGPAGATRWLLTVHNLASEMAAQQVAVAVGGRQRWLYRRDAEAARRLEASVVRSYDGIITVAPGDGDILAAGAGLEVDEQAGRIHLVPNGVDTVRFTLSPVPADPRVVFTGALAVAPNRDGAVWFARDVLPLVRAAVPAVAFDVVGAAPPPEVVALADLPGVRVHADVPAIEPWLVAARVAVVPLRIGSGTRLKALEGLAAGRPVVGTTVGLEGLGLIDGTHALMGDTPADLAAAVVRALTDDALAGRLAVAGRALVEERYSWDVVGRRLAQVVLG